MGLPAAAFRARCRLIPLRQRSDLFKIFPAIRAMVFVKGHNDKLDKAFLIS